MALNSTKTGLSSQLNTLRERDQQQQHLTKKLTTSLLFDMKKSGLISSEKIQELAREGYHNLTKTNPKIANFQPLILSPTTSDRMSLTPAENNALSLEIKRLLRALSSNFLNINTLRILEFLLRNYDVHRFEGEDLIINFLAYHSTGPYIKLLQNIDLSKKISRFHFLNETVRAGEAFERGLLVAQSMIDCSILGQFADFLKNLKSEELSENGVFVTSKMREEMGRDPSVAFFCSLLGECLQNSVKTGRKRQEVKLVVLRFIAQQLDHNGASGGAEGLSGVMMLLVELILSKNVSPKEIKIIMLDVWDRVKEYNSGQNSAFGGLGATQKAHFSQFLKIFIFVFQTNKNLILDEDLVTILHHEDSLSTLFSLRTSMTPILVSIYKNFVVQKRTHLEIFEPIFRFCIKEETSLVANIDLRHSLILGMLNELKIKKSEKILKIFKNCLGDEFYEVLAEYLGALEQQEEPDEPKKASKLKKRAKFFEKILEENEVYKMVSVEGYSKTSLVLALSSQYSAVKKKAIEILGNSEGVPNKAISDRLKDILRFEDDSEVVEQLVGLTQFISVAEKQEDREIGVLLFSKFLGFQRNQGVVHKIRGVKNKLLRRFIELYEVLFAQETKKIQNMDKSLLSKNWHNSPKNGSSGDVSVKVEQTDQQESEIRSFLITVAQNLDFGERLKLGRFFENGASGVVSGAELHLKVIEFAFRNGINLVYEQKFGEIFSEILGPKFDNLSQKELLNFFKLIQGYKNLFDEQLNLKIASKSEFLQKRVFSLLLQKSTKNVSTDTRDEQGAQQLIELFAWIVESQPKEPKNSKTKISANFEFSAISLFLKAIINSEYQSHSLVKLLQAMNYEISRSGSENLKKAIFTKIVKIIVSNSLTFVTNAPQLLQDQSNLVILRDTVFKDKKGSKSFLSNFADFSLKNHHLYEFYEFLGLIERITVKNGSKIEANVHNSVLGSLASNSILGQIRGILGVSEGSRITQSLSRLSDEQDMALKIAKKIFKILVQFGDSESAYDEIEAFFYQNHLYRLVSSDFLMSVAKYKNFENLVLSFFEQNEHIETYEDLLLTPNQLLSTIKGLKSEDSVSRILTYLSSNFSPKTTQISVEDDHSELLDWLEIIKALFLHAKKLKTQNLGLCFEVIILVTKLIKAQKHVQVCLTHSVLATKNMRKIQRGQKIEIFEAKKSKKIFVQFTDLCDLNVLESFQDTVLGYLEAILGSFGQNVASKTDGEIFELKFIRTYLALILGSGAHSLTLARSIISKILQKIDSLFKKAKTDLQTKKTDKNDLFSHRTLTSIIQAAPEKKETTVLSKIAKQVDFLYLKIFDTIAQNYSSKKLILCSEVLYRYLEHREEHRTTGLLRLLTSFYQKQEKRSFLSQAKANPLAEDQIWEACSFLKTLVTRIFNERNLFVVTKILFIFYMNNIKKIRPVEEREDDSADDDGSEAAKQPPKGLPIEPKITKSTKNRQLKFDQFCQFISKFLMSINFTDTELLERASLLIKTLVSGIKTLKGFIPLASKRLKKNFVCKFLKKLLNQNLGEESLRANPALPEIRSARLCLLFSTYLKTLFSSKNFGKYLTAAVLQNEENFEDSELIQDLEALMNAGFEFDVEIEKIENLIRAKKSLKKLKLFEKLKSVCGVNIKLISKFIPVEIYPIFVKKRLEFLDQKEEENGLVLGTLCRFMNAFVDRVPESRLSDKFRTFFSDCFGWFVKSKIVTGKGQKAPKKLISGRADHKARFIQAFFTCLSLIHKKIPNFTEKVISGHFGTLIGIIRRQRNAIVAVGCLTSLANFSRNLNEDFLEYLGNFVILSLSLSMKLIRKNLETTERGRALFASILSRFDEMYFENVDFSYLPILKKQALRSAKEDLHASFLNPELPDLVTLSTLCLARHIGNVLEPYLTPLITTSILLKFSKDEAGRALKGPKMAGIDSEGQKNGQNGQKNGVNFGEELSDFSAYLDNRSKNYAVLERLLKEFSQKIDLTTLIKKVKMCLNSVEKSYIALDSYTHINFLVSEMIQNGAREQLIDSRDPTFSTIFQIFKLSCKRINQLEKHTFEMERLRGVHTLTSFALKFSEKVFKRYYEKLLKWSKLSADYDPETLEGTEKQLTLLKFHNNFISKIGFLGVTYYGYIFDYLVGFLENLHTVHAETLGRQENAKNEDFSLLGKRAESGAQGLTEAHLKLHSEVVQALDLLFRSDAKTGFVDSIKFEKMVNPLSRQLNLFLLVPGPPKAFRAYAEGSIVPMLVSLFNLVQDEFMLKTLQFSLMKHTLGSESVVVRVLGAKLMQEVVDSFAEKFIVILNDFVPFLSEMLDDEEPEVAVIGRSILKIIEQNTSEDVVRLIKNARM